MTVIVNGKSRVVPDGVTVAEVVSLVSAAPRGVAVALNGDLIRRGVWSATTLRDTDRLEVLTATQGG